MQRDVSTALLEADQDAFVRALWGAEERIPPSLLGPRGAASAKRLGVYRNNAFASLTRCLSARFPVIQRLVGEEFFRAMAAVFVEAHPPVSPALLEYGDAFPAFLEKFSPVRTLPYLADVARLELLIAHAYHARDARAADAAALGVLGDDALEAQLILHPSCRTLISGHAVFSIWETNTRDVVVRPVEASSGGEALLVVRPCFDVTVVRIDTATYAFIAALAARHSLEVAAEIAAELSDAFDVSVALQMLFTLGAVVGVHLPRNARPTEPQSMRMLSCAT
ncbi:MAG: DUF2063 domain-containing protein [Hyphomicrobium sp.]